MGTIVSTAYADLMKVCYLDYKYNFKHFSPHAAGGKKYRDASYGSKLSTGII